MGACQTVYNSCADYLCCSCAGSNNVRQDFDPNAEDFDLPSGPPYSDSANAAWRLQSTPSGPPATISAGNAVGHSQSPHVRVVPQATFNPPAKSTLIPSNYPVWRSPGSQQTLLGQTSPKQQKKVPSVVKVRIMKSGVDRSSAQSPASPGDKVTTESRGSGLSAISLSMKVKARQSGLSGKSISSPLSFSAAARSMMPLEFLDKPPVIVYMDDSMYWGETKEKMRDGFGLWTSADITYCGEWTNDKQEGPGKQVWADGRKYEGQFSGGCFHGIGKMIWVYEDGEMYYQGEYKDDKKSGHGSFVWADGRRYSGNWFDGKRHGEGIFTSPTGEVTRGVWDQDKVVSIEGEDEDRTNGSSLSIDSSLKK
eukprot:GEMP01024524.1.p1 GENE.GEMP01024524.1~~GEMP01024524.1.p1  ORF type:complete len:366 (+),score=62.49 GEMP01024524.1:125-1222(+)